MYEDYELNRVGSKYRISILHYKNKENILEKITYYFTDKFDFTRASRKLDSINIETRDGKQRNFWVFVNPISGKQVAREYFKTILAPAFEFLRMQFEMFETDSENYLDSFFERMNMNTMEFTDFVVIGGDGMFNQLLNGIMRHPDSQKLLKIPIGLMPGGSSNALWWDLDCKDPYLAAINILRGDSVQGDFFKLDMVDTWKTFYSTAMTYGFPWDLILESQSLRNLFGRYRYVATGVKKVLSPASLPDYKSEIYFKDHSDSSPVEVDSAPVKRKTMSDISTRKPLINLPKVTKIKKRGVSFCTKNEDKWTKFEYDKFLFYAVATHEIRSSLSEEVVAPFTRINDGNMYIFGVKDSNKISALKWVAKVSDGGHLIWDKYFSKKVTELKIKNPEGAHFCIDGELFKSSEYNIKLIPRALNLIGRVKGF